MPPGYHQIKKNASKVPAYSTTPPKRIITGRHSKPRKVGGDPVFGFLQSAAKATYKAVKPSFTDPIGEAKRELHVAKKTYGKLNSAAGWELHQIKEKLTPDRKPRKPRKLSDMELNELAVSPGGIGRILTVGQSGLDIAEPLARTLGRVRPGGGVHVVHGPDMGYVGDRGWPTRFPWIINKKSGEVYVGKLGDSHRDVLARHLGTTDRSQLGGNWGSWHGGFLSARDDVGNLEMEWGPFSGLAPPRNQEPSRRLLEMMFGKSHNSPYEERHFWHPEIRGTRQGVTQQSDDEFLRELYDEEMLAKQLKRLKAARMKHGYRGRT